MQIQGLHKSIYSLYCYARTQECLEKYRNVYLESTQKWEEAKENGGSEELASKYAGISRATYYRRKKILKQLEKGLAPPSKRPKRLNKPRWGEAEMQLVLRIRRENPTYGKEKIAVILKRDFAQTLSESTVGRILKHLMEKGLITKSASALRTKRKRVFNKHAQPWTFKKYKDLKLGERVQIDHMTVTKNGITVKHFQAWERRSKFLKAGVFSQATAKSAKRFLLEFVRQAPFKIQSIQVDGGSEFMRDFEEACGDLKIPLLILPPSTPQHNGGVERCNRTFREEFYSRTDLLEDSVRGIQAALSKAVDKYNTYRPHRSLNGMTPLEYIQTIHPETFSESQSM